MRACAWPFVHCGRCPSFVGGGRPRDVSGPMHPRPAVPATLASELVFHVDALVHSPNLSETNVTCNAGRVAA